MYVTYMLSTLLSPIGMAYVNGLCLQLIEASINGGFVHLYSETFNAPAIVRSHLIRMTINLPLEDFDSLAPFDVYHTVEP